MYIEAIPTLLRQEDQMDSKGKDKNFMKKDFIRVYQ